LLTYDWRNNTISATPDCKRTIRFETYRTLYNIYVRQGFHKCIVELQWELHLHVEVTAKGSH